MSAAPNLNKLNTVAYHDMALDLLDHMMQERRETLRIQGRNEANAAVSGEDWRNDMVHLWRISPYLAREIDDALKKAGLITTFGGYRQPIQRAKPVNITEQFFCSTHRKLKGFALPTYQIGEQVNYTVPGTGGHVAHNQIGIIENIDMRGVLRIKGPGKPVFHHKGDVTPAWAPSPLLYKNHGKCECFFDPAEEAAS